jgi:MFS transporter, ACS family, solute carrier family 17 (sodium-dependent inorganic phosphate cotransporter), other
MVETRRSPTLLVSMCFLAVVVGYTDRVNMSVASIAMRTALGWSQTTKGFVLSAFFIGYMSCMALAGWLATRFGGRTLLGIAVALWSAFTLVTPLAAKGSLAALILTRIGMGIGEFAMFPACYQLISALVSPVRITRAVTRILSGIALGTVFGLVSCGWIVANLGWEATFYVFGAVGVIWTAVWFSTTEADHGAGADAHSRGPHGEPSAKVPWRRLLRTRALWALFVSHFCSNRPLYFFLSWLPTYFAEARGLSIAAAGLFSAGPWLVMALSTNLAGWVADSALQRGTDLTLIRKTLQTVGLVIPAISLALVQHAGSILSALLLVCFAVGALGCTWAGVSANAIDIAPRYSAAIMGVSNTIATVPGVVGVSFTGWLVDRTGTFTAAFVVAAGFCLVGASVYLAWASARPVVE